MVIHWSLRKFWNRYYHDWDTSKLSDEKWIETEINQSYTNVNLYVRWYLHFFILIATVTVEIDNGNVNGIFYPITTHLDVATVKAIDLPWSLYNKNCNGEID